MESGTRLADPRGMRLLLADVREMLTEEYEYRELLAQMTRRDLMLRYKQTIMGIGWAVFMPLLNTAVFSVIFTRVASIDTPVPYPIFAYCGLLVWNFTASSLRFSVNSLTSNSQLVTKVYFPREIFPISSVLVCLVDFGVGAIVLAVMMLYYQIVPTSALLLLPIVVVVHIIFTCGVALLLAMANLFYRDVKYLFEIAVTVWMFLTSVLYPVQLITGRLHLLMLINPMTPIIDAYRSVILLGTAPDPLPFYGCAVFSVVLLALSWLVFHRAEFQFAENI
jgi:lipopolysaccharide transport system permease protein